VYGTKSAQEIFQPEGLCAVCAEEEPVLEEPFLFNKETTNLGFCSEICLGKFIIAVIALARAIES
jgi:hypothetical protein